MSMSVEFESGNDDFDPEFQWLEEAGAASQALALGRGQEADERWRVALDLAGRFRAGDPRRAASLNGLGLVLARRGDPLGARKRLEAARAAWEAAADWVEHMQLEARARSSLFHLRLEGKHRDAYNQRARRKYHELLDAGLGATLYNLAVLAGDGAAALRESAAGAAARAQASEAARCTVLNDRLSQICGESVAGSPDQAARGLAARFSAEAVAHRWMVDRPPVFTDEGRLMAALVLAELLDEEPVTA